MFNFTPNCILDNIFNDSSILHLFRDIIPGKDQVLADPD